MKLFSIYDSIPDYKRKREFREKITTGCMIQQSTFYLWKRRGRIPELAKEKIAELLEIPIEELFPVED